MPNPNYRIDCGSATASAKSQLFGNHRFVCACVCACVCSSHSTAAWPLPTPTPQRKVSSTSCTATMGNIPRPCLLTPCGSLPTLGTHPCDRFSCVHFFMLSFQTCTFTFFLFCFFFFFAFLFLFRIRVGNSYSSLACDQRGFSVRLFPYHFSFLCCPLASFCQRVKSVEIENVSLFFADRLAPPHTTKAHTTTTSSRVTFSRS